MAHAGGAGGAADIVWRRADRSFAELPFPFPHRIPQQHRASLEQHGRERIAAGKPSGDLSLPPSIAARPERALMDCAEALRRVGIAASTLSSRESRGPLEEGSRSCRFALRSRGIDPDRGRGRRSCARYVQEMPRRPSASWRPYTGCRSRLGLMADKVVHGPAAAALLGARLWPRRTRGSWRR